MTKCFFVSDLHGHVDKYQKLIDQIVEKKPKLVFLGGDLLPHGFGIKPGYDDFYNDYILPAFTGLRKELGKDYPIIYLILGNDDPRINEQDFIQGQETGLWKYTHEKVFQYEGITIIGYAYVPPTPFRLKDWERYDVSRYVDPGCIHPMEGFFSIQPEGDIEFQTMREDLEHLSAGIDLSNAIMLFHSPPYQTHLDRAALDNLKIEHVPLDLHVGSIAIKRFIEERAPSITLHGHIHESARMTGHWHEFIGKTLAVNAAWDGPELSLVIFDPKRPGEAKRILV